MSRFYNGTRSTASFILFLAVGLFIGWNSAVYHYEKDWKTGEAPLTSNSEVSTAAFQLDLLWEVYDFLKKDYFDSTALQEETLRYGAIKGLVSSLKDPYSTFMDPKETKEFQASLEGTLEGIGAELSMEEGHLTVIAPLKGSPAEQAGLKPGDIVYKIDDAFVVDLTLFDAIRKIRGEAGTTVKLTILREGADDMIELSIQRAQIDVPTVELSFLGEEENIAHLTIYQFGDKTETEFDKVVQDLLLKNLDGMVLDLRSNGGGFLDVSIDILSDFLEGKQEAVLTKHRDESDNEIYYTNESARLAKIPLVVLVNEGSASASEIVAGAIQDYKRGILMGTQTFGKGSVQVVEMLEDGSSLRFTTAKWFTPNDRSIDEVGITPDQIVEITNEDIQNKRDPQLDAALDYLKNL